MSKSRRILTLRNNQWSKKINKKIYYFGTDYQAAVKRYLFEREYIEAGLPVPESSGNTVALLLDEFLSDRLSAFESGILAERTYNDLVEVCDIISEAIPLTTPLRTLRPANFKRVREFLEKGKNQDVGISTLNRRLGYARQVFRFAHIDQRLVAVQLPYTQSLKSVPAKELRRHSNAIKRIRLFEPAEIRLALSRSSVIVKAMIMLGINGAFNNSDIAHLPLDMLSGGMPDFLLYERHKTYQERMVPLWKETKDALQEYLDIRQDSDRPELFITQREGKPFHDNTTRNCKVSKLFYMLLCRLDAYSEGKNFGALRTTFASVAVDTDEPDDAAVQAIMGHVQGSMLFRKYAPNAIFKRCKPVTDRVHDWLYG